MPCTTSPAPGASPTRPSPSYCPRTSPYHRLPAHTGATNVMTSVHINPPGSHFTLATQTASTGPRTTDPPTPFTPATSLNTARRGASPTPRHPEPARLGGRIRPLR